MSAKPATASKPKGPHKSADNSFNTISGSKNVKERKFSTIVKVNQKLNYDSEDDKIKIKNRAKGSSIFNSDETETRKTSSLSPKIKGNFKSFRGSVKNEAKSLLSKTHDVINTKSVKRPKYEKNNLMGRLDEPEFQERQNISETD